MGAYVVRTSRLNNNHSCQLFRMGLRGKPHPHRPHLNQGQHELWGSYHLLQSWFSFFVHLHGQTEPFSSYHLLQSWFSFFVRLRGQPEPFGSCIILQSCSSFFFCLHGQPELFASDHLLQSSFLSNSFSSPRFILLRVARHWFSWSSVSDDLFFSSFLLYLFRSIFFASVPQPFFPLFFSL